MGARKGSGCVEHDFAGRAPPHDVPVRQHQEMTAVRVALGQAENLGPAGALASPYSDLADVRAAVRRNGTLGREENPDPEDPGVALRRRTSETAGNLGNLGRRQDRESRSSGVRRPDEDCRRRNRIAGAHYVPHRLRNSNPGPIDESRVQYLDDHSHLPHRLGDSNPGPIDESRVRYLDEHSHLQRQKGVVGTHYVPHPLGNSYPVPIDESGVRDPIAALRHRNERSPVPTDESGVRYLRETFPHRNISHPGATNGGEGSRREPRSLAVPFGRITDRQHQRRKDEDY
jgi:hypothetical protein